MTDEKLFEINEIKKEEDLIVDFVIQLLFQLEEEVD